MTKTTRHERRKRAHVSGRPAGGRMVSKELVKKDGPPVSSLDEPAPRLPVSKDGSHRQLVKRPTPSKQVKTTQRKPAVSTDGSSTGKKKRRRSEVLEGQEEEEEEEEDRGGQQDEKPPPQVVVDELMATIQEHDHFFSRMLDMIPEHLVLPTKEATESSYASKYMKNKTGAAPQQSKKEESKKNKRARYAADNQKTVLERQQERARGKAEGAEDGTSNAAEEDMEVDSDGGGEAGTGRPEEDGLESEVLRGKNMDVASMDALKKRIEERIKDFQEKRTAAAGSRRAKTAQKRSAQHAAKRDNKRKGMKAKKKGREAAIAATAAKAKANAEGTGVPNKAKEAASSKDKGTNGVKGDRVPVAEPQLPPLPSVEDVGDIEFSGLRGVAGQGGSRNNYGLPKVGAPGSKMKRLHGLLEAAEEKKKRLAGLRQSEEGKEKAKMEGWADAIRVAGGGEVKDNPAALKKMIKRKEKEKAKSAAKWDDRMSGQRKEQSKRQDKREENLNRRKNGGVGTAASAEKGASEGDGAKRQRRAGFEGKKQDFINKERPRGGADGGRGRGGDGRGGGGRGRGRGGGGDRDGGGRDGGGRGRGGGRGEGRGGGRGRG